jgi:hypothetical protein
LLLIAAALLTASMHSFGVVEAPVAPAPHSAVVVAAVAKVPEGNSVPRPVMTGVQITVDDLAAAHGRTFLVDLTGLGRSDLLQASGDRRGERRAGVGVGGGGGGGAAPPPRLETFAPSVVGNLDGVPYAVRDRANRAVLASGLADHAASAARAALLGQVRDSLRHDVGAPDRYLVTLDTRGSGRAAIAIGDLDTAADVTVVVPGMFFTVTGQMTDFTNTANDLYSEQATLSGIAAPGSGSGVAVVAWMGYRTPDLSNILSLGLAKTGAARLERAVDGVRQVRDGEEPRVNIVAHSYGSTTALMALASGKMRADTLTVLGSPGSDVQHAGDLAVQRDQVFVGDAHSDPIAGSGYFGTDPGSAAFGSTLLDLAGGVDTQDAGDVFRRPVGHNDYLKPGTASLHDVALIAVGRGDLVREQVRRGEGGRDGVPQSPDMYLVRPQDLQPRD